MTADIGRFVDESAAVAMGWVSFAISLLHAEPI